MNYFHFPGLQAAPFASGGRALSAGRLGWEESQEEDFSFFGWRRRGALSRPSTENLPPQDARAQRFGLQAWDNPTTSATKHGMQKPNQIRRRMIQNCLAIYSILSIDKTSP